MKVAFYLKDDKSKKRTRIFARISLDGVALKYYLPESIHPDHWNKESYRARRSKDFKEYPEFNARMDSFESSINTVFRTYLIENNNDYPSPAQLRILLDKAIKKIEPIRDAHYSFFGYYENFIESSKIGKRLQPQNAKRYSTATIQIYNNTYNRLIEFQKWQKKPIDFKDIDMQFYNDFRHYLTEVLNLNPNTICKDIKTIKTVMNDATDRGYNTNLIFRNKGFVCPSVDSDAIYLNKSELSEMLGLDLSSNPQLDNVRYTFLMACYTGLRFSDISKLTKDHFKNGYIEIAQSKTEYKVTIPIHDELNKLLLKHNWVLPVRLSNPVMNRLLKELGKLMASLNSTIHISVHNGGKTIIENMYKWEKLTTHTARRSFATNNFIAGIPPLSIMAITGHKSEKTFMRYLKLDGMDHARLIKQNWDRNAG